MCAETLGCMYADFGCIYAETLGCMYADFGCMYAETPWVHVCGFWVHVCGNNCVQSMRMLGASTCKLSGACMRMLGASL